MSLMPHKTELCTLLLLQTLVNLKDFKERRFSNDSDYVKVYNVIYRVS